MSDSTKSLLKRVNSLCNMPAATDQLEAKVLVIYTGGTFGMMRNEHGALQPIQNALVKKIRKYPHMHDSDYAQLRFGSDANMGPFVLPHVQGETRRIIYTIIENDPLLDSSNMTMNDWIHIADDIQQSYEFFDGFLVIHGTDTLSYTASALSFMLENLGKTVIITGSQIPIFETRTDGYDNFTAGLILASNYVIPEVCVMFGSKLMRGNRTIKMNSASLAAFDTPNFPPIATMGLDVNINYKVIHRPVSDSKFRVETNLNDNVGILRIFPSITRATISAFLQPPMLGVVLQTYGSGNIPSNRAYIIDELKMASDRGVIIINCTQCTSGSVSAIYETGCVLTECGVLSGFDMTPEAALAKLSYVLGKSEWSLDTKKSMMQHNLRGEISTSKSSVLLEYDLIEAVARSIRISSPAEFNKLSDTLFPALVNSATLEGNVEKLELLKTYGADLSSVNYDNRSALHIACCEGNMKIVKQLLLNSVSVHKRDRHDRTPLMEAIQNDHHDIIKVLIKCGAHLVGSSYRIGESLCNAASRGMIRRLESFRLAGADLSQPDLSKRTALHMGCLHGSQEVVAYLLKHSIDINGKDLLGMTALEYARQTNHNDIADLISPHQTNGTHTNGISMNGGSIS